MVAEEKEEEEEDDVGVVVVKGDLLMVLLKLRIRFTLIFSENTLTENNWLPTDGPTDGQTHPHIEMRGSI